MIKGLLSILKNKVQIPALEIDTDRERGRDKDHFYHTIIYTRAQLHVELDVVVPVNSSTPEAEAEGLSQV